MHSVLDANGAPLTVASRHPSAWASVFLFESPLCSTDPKEEGSEDLGKADGRRLVVQGVVQREMCEILRVNEKVDALG